MAVVPPPFPLSAFNYRGLVLFKSFSYSFPSLTLTTSLGGNLGTCYFFISENKVSHKEVMCLTLKGDRDQGTPSLVLVMWQVQDSPTVSLSPLSLFLFIFPSSVFPISSGVKRTEGKKEKGAGQEEV